MRLQPINLSSASLALLVFSLLSFHAAAKITIHNNSDCCCENIYPRSAKNLVSTVEECVSNCQADPQCHAAVFLTTGVVRQCELPGPAPAGKACCIHKRHFDTMGSSPVGSVAIDMGTSSGGCPSPSPKPPAPTPAGAIAGEALRPWYHFTRESGEMNGE